MYARYLCSRAHSAARPSARNDMVSCIQGEMESKDSRNFDMFIFCTSLVFKTLITLYTIYPIVARAFVCKIPLHARALGLKAYAAARPSARDDRVSCIQRALGLAAS